MAKGPIVTLDIEILIRRVHQEHPKWKAPMVRNEVESVLRKKNPNTPRKWPSLSKVQKVLATIRRKEKEVSEEDELWHIGTLKKFPIPPEALPRVIGFWLLRCKEGRAFTIREARWLARLYAVFKEPVYQGVDFFVLNYAANEEALETLGFPPGFLPFHEGLDTWLAQEVTSKNIDEETKSNIKKLYKSQMQSDIELKAAAALKDYEC